MGGIDNSNDCSSADGSHISSVTRNFRAKIEEAAGPLDYNNTEDVAR
jgi:hypothetical protein